MLGFGASYIRDLTVRQVLNLCPKIVNGRQKPISLTDFLHCIWNSNLNFLCIHTHCDIKLCSIREKLFYYAICTIKGIWSLWSHNTALWVSHRIWLDRSIISEWLLWGMSLTSGEVSKIFSRNLCFAEIVFIMRILSWYFVCVPKAGYGHTYKVTAWNSHYKCDFLHWIFRGIIFKSSRNVSETTPSSRVAFHYVWSVLFCSRLPDRTSTFFVKIQKRRWNSI